MNRKSYVIAINGLSPTLRKVFDATPIAEAWRAGEIAAEMKRLGLGGNDATHALGCLNSLVNSGLVKEEARGHFRRTQVRDKPTAQEQSTTTAETKEIQPPKEVPMSTPAKAATEVNNPIDRLSQFAIRLRALANDMETAALELAEQTEKNEAETAKMRQLQQILKSLG